MLVLSTIDKIVNAARECFFQHGYSAANVSLICRYAGISRATIYKSFSSKETIFRAVVQSHIEEKHAFLEQYELSTKDFWLDTEQLILDRCQGIFDDIPNATIRSELVHAGKTLCTDIVLAEKSALKDSITKRLITEIKAQRISLDKAKISSDEFAQLIETVPFGIVLSSMDDNSRVIIKNMFNVFKASVSLN